MTTTTTSSSSSTTSSAKTAGVTAATASVPKVVKSAATSASKKPANTSSAPPPSVAPKSRVGGSFIKFSQENRNKLQLENPGAKFTEVSKLLGQKWKALTNEQKESYSSTKKKV